MTKWPPVSIAFLSCLLAFPLSVSYAEEKKLPPHVCESPEKLAMLAKSCERGNAAFIQAAQNCLKLLNGYELQAAEMAKRGFSKDLDPSQTGKFDSAATDYAVSAQNYTQLIALTEIALSDLKKYSSEAKLPLSFFIKKITGPNPAAWADNKPCYGGTQRRLGEALGVVSRKLAGFTAAKAASEEMSAKSGSRVVNVNSLNSAASATRGSSATVQPLPKSGKSDSKASQITGVEQDRAKRRLAPAAKP